MNWGHKKNWLQGIILVVVILGGIGFATITHASLGQVSLEPVDHPVTGEGRGTFRLIVEPNTVTEDRFVVYNNSDETVVAYIFPSGYELLKGKITEVELPDNAPDEPGKWLEIDTQEITLAPKSQREIGFRINSPETIDVGDHLATLFVQALEPNTIEQGSGIGLSINVRSGVRIYMTVPGEINRVLNITKISHQVQPFWKLFTKELIFFLTFENQGNITLQPEIDINVQGIFGHVGTQEGAQFVKIRRGKTETSSKEWIERAPYFGRFVADFDVHLGEREQVNDDGTKTLLPDEIIKAKYVFWIFPWIEIIYLLSILFLIYLLRSAWLYYIIIGRLKTTTTIYTVKKDENLAKIANNLGIHPKRLVKFNMIPWPYQVETGDKLLIPTGKLAGKEWRSQIITTIKDKNIWGGVFGHLFKNRSVNKLTDRHIQPTGEAKPQEDLQKVVADKGDTIDDIAEFAGVDKAEIIKLNKLKSPYRLKAGQELKIPNKKSKRRK